MNFTDIKKEKIELSYNERVLSYASIGKLFLRYSLPGVVGYLFFGLQSVTDAIIVGNYLGSNALASVNLVIPCYSFVAVLTIVLGIGAQTVVSISFGERDYKKAQDAMTSGYLSLLLFCSLLGAFIFIFAEPIMGLLGADDMLIGDSVRYLKGFIPFIPFIGTMFYNDYQLKALGKPRFAMIISTSVVMLNVILSILFTTQMELGTYGVGLATGVSFTIGAIVSSFITFSKRNLISMLGGRFNWKLVWQMLYNGSSEGMSELAIAISMMLFNITLMRYAGADGVAAFTAINYTHFVGSTLFLGVSDGIIPIVSYNYGAKKRERVIKTFRLGVKTNLITGFILFLLLFFFGRPIISLFFRSGSEHVIELAAAGARIYAFAFLMSGFNILSTSFFTAMADAKISIIIAVLRGVIFVAAGLSVLPTLMGITGIWLSVPLAEMLTITISILLVYRAIKYKLKFKA